jgi:hypothetical protein
MSSPVVARTARRIVFAHLAITLIHGTAHSMLGIGMAPWQNVYIILVIIVLPIVAALWISRAGRGYALLAASMIGALVFGVDYHFVVAGADNVASVGAHAMGTTFRTTAVLLAITEVAGAIVGLVGLRTALPRQLSSPRV